MTQHMSASIIVCSHNPRPDYISRVVAALQIQTFPLESWELIIVDNRSDVPICDFIDISWHPLGRHVRESELGLTPARLRGISEAQSELLIFVDDDNVLEASYIEGAVDIAEHWGQLGAWSGHVSAEFELAPPDWTRSFWPFLAIRPCDSPRWSNSPDDHDAMPAGAGLCVRRSIALKYVASLQLDERRRAMDRRGSSLVSGGDVDLVLECLEVGLGFGRFPNLRLSHLIPAGRLREEYLLRLVSSISYSGVLLSWLRGGKLANSSSFISRLVWDVRALKEGGLRGLRFRRAWNSGQASAVAAISDGKFLEAPSGAGGP